MPDSISAHSLDRLGTFGKPLRFLRIRAGLTQIELSIAVGCSDAQISRLEQDRRLPNVAAVEARFVPALCLRREPAARDRLLRLAAEALRKKADAIVDAEPTPAEPTRSIAAMPFKNLTADSDNEYFCEGLAEELLNALAKIRRLFVVARASAFSFKGKDLSEEDLARDNTCVGPSAAPTCFFRFAALFSIVSSYNAISGGFLLSAPGVSAFLGTGYPTVLNGSKRHRPSRVYQLIRRMKRTFPNTWRSVFESCAVRKPISGTAVLIEHCRHLRI